MGKAWGAYQVLLGVAVGGLGIANICLYATTPQINEVEALNNAGKKVVEYQYTGREQAVEYRGKTYQLVTPADALDYAKVVVQDVASVNKDVKKLSELEQTVISAKEGLGTTTAEAVYKPVLESIGDKLKDTESRHTYQLVLGTTNCVLGMVNFGLGCANLAEKDYY
jgi:hypothetical protein